MTEIPYEKMTSLQAEKVKELLDDHWAFAHWVPLDNNFGKAVLANAEFKLKRVYKSGAAV